MISVCLIVENEERHIKDCLDSLKWCEEVIVVDNRSTDKTAEICRQYKNVKLHINSLWEKYITCSAYFWDERRLKRIFRYATSRNRSIKRATGDWILILDADERISNPENLKTLTENYESVPFIENGQQVKDEFGNPQTVAIDAWYLLQHSITEHGFESPCKTTRLWKNGLGIIYEKEVHETPDNYIDRNHLKRGESDLRIEHVGFKDASRNRLKSDRIIDAIKWEGHLYKNYYLGIAYLQKRDIDTGIHYLNLALEDPMPYNIMAHAHAILSDMYRQYMEFYKRLAEERLNSSLKLTPEQNLSYLIQAGLYKFTGQKGKAVKELTKIYNRDSLRSLMHQDILLSKELIQQKIKETKNGLPTN